MRAAGLVLFGKRYRFLKRVDGADARIGRTPIEIGFHAQENRAMIPSDVFLIRFSRFSASAAAHGVTQKPTSLINQGLRRILR
jgi:hypothetical protein